MAKRFKSKKNKNKILLKILFYIIIILTVVFFSFNNIYGVLTKDLTEMDVINILLNNDLETNKKNNSLEFLINYSLGINLKDQKEEIIPVTNIVEQENKNHEIPLIYIYNTHQTEEYKKINNNSYNITPTVLHASLIFQSKLSDVGINSVVEENNIKEILNINGWSYKNSYKASKILAEDVLSKNPSIKYVIDLHRDSIPESIGKITINNKDYAKIMLVLGSGHEGYQRNLEFANRINNYLKEFDENITRGIDIKKNSGIYNQDLSPNAVLIEVGGPYNDIKSVNNSLEVLANIYKRIVDEDNEKEET